LTRERVCRLQLLLVLASAVILGSESCGTREHILLPQIRDSHDLEGQVPVVILPRVPFASHPTTRRGMGRLFSTELITTLHGQNRKYLFQQYPNCVFTDPLLRNGFSIVACMFISARTYLPSRCQGMNYYGFQASCHIIKIVKL
jgi:hypothetical protein